MYLEVISNPSLSSWSYHLCNQTGQKWGRGAHPHFAAHCTESASAAAAKCIITAENSLNLEKKHSKVLLRRCLQK